MFQVPDKGGDGLGWVDAVLYQCTEEFVYTKEGTFNFGALEVTDLIEILLLLYSRRIMLQGMRVDRNIRLRSLLPLCPNDFPFHQCSELQL